MKEQRVLMIYWVIDMCWLGIASSGEREQMAEREASFSY